MDGRVAGQIGVGLLVLVGVARTRHAPGRRLHGDKVTGLRVFPDEAGKMNRNVKEAEGSLLIVSQFTLYGDVRRGRRPSFDGAAGPQQARPLYEYFVEAVRASGCASRDWLLSGRMSVHLINDGPVTIIVDSGQIT